MMRHATRSERREIKELGASLPLYRQARRAGVTHEEVLSVLREESSFWRYELFRTTGVTHAEAVALEAEGVDAISYRDLRRIGIPDVEVRDAHRRGAPLDVYFSARKAGLGHDEAIGLVEAGFRHAASPRHWNTAARARQLLAGRHEETPENLTLMVRKVPGFKGGAKDLVEEIAAARVSEEMAA